MIKTFVNILVLITIILIAYFMVVNKKQIDQPDWENPGVFSINKEDPKAHFFIMNLRIWYYQVIQKNHIIISP